YASRSGREQPAKERGKRLVSFLIFHLECERKAKVRVSLPRLLRFKFRLLISAARGSAGPRMGREGGGFIQAREFDTAPPAQWRRDREKTRRRRACEFRGAVRAPGEGGAPTRACFAPAHRPTHGERAGHNYQ